MPLTQEGVGESLTPRQRWQADRSGRQMQSEEPQNNPESSSPAAGGLDRVVRVAQLLDLYGGLLTERQSRFIEMHYNEDLSFGEIAKEAGISRQAVHEAVKHGEAALAEYEDKLKLLAKGYSKTAAAVTPGAPKAEQPAPAPRLPAGAGTAVKKLRELHERLRRSGGIIYNAEGMTRELGGLVSELEAMLAAGGEGS